MTDPLDELVRQALQARADRVTVAPDALSRIRARTGRRRTLAVGLASLATVATAVVVALLVGVLRAPVPAVPAPASQPPPVTVTGAVDRLPIYFTAPVADASVLYREFHPATGPVAVLPDRIEAAVRIMLAGRPFDPDYRSEWPASVSVREIGVDARPVATVDLTGTMPTGTAGALALQQLTWTVTAVAADRGVQLTGVQIRHDGADWSDGPLTRAPALETLAPVWLIAPQQGDTVGRTVSVHVAAIVGTSVRLRVVDAGGAVVSDTPIPVTAVPGAGATASRGEGYLAVALAPGRYTLEASVPVAGGGPQALDDHVITVT